MGLVDDGEPAGEESPFDLFNEAQVRNRVPGRGGQRGADVMERRAFNGRSSAVEDEITFHGG